MKSYRRVIVLIVLLGGLSLIGLSLAAPGAITLERYVIGSGAGRGESGSVTVDGTIGQVFVGSDTAAPYELCYGFWCGLDVALGDLIFASGFESTEH